MMSNNFRDQVNSATMIATHEVVTNLIKTKSAIENLIHENQDLTVLTTVEGRVIWGNTTAARWLSCPHDSLHEAFLSKIFDPCAWTIFAGQLQEKAQTLGQGESGDFHSSILREGENRDILWNIRPFRAVSDRRGVLLVVVGRDITEVLRERTEKTRLESELATAQVMQEAFFPPAEITTPTLKLSSYYRPADQCSGDWWGYFDLGLNRELVCIADVTGHGAASALVAGMTQALSLSFATRHFQSPDAISPARLIAEINDVVYKTFRGDMYMTFYALVFDHQQRKAVISNAAHTFPFRLAASRKSGQNPDSITVPGNPVGHAIDSEYVECEVETHKGDRFLLYTDGVTECRNRAGKLYGNGAFRRSILKYASLPLEDFRDKLVQEAMGFTQGQPLADDFTLTTFEIR